MAAITCPYCRSISHMTYRVDSAFRVSTDPPVATAAFTCDECRRMLSATVSIKLSDINASQRDSASVLAPRVLAGLDDADWEPKRVVGKVILDIPQHIAEPADEAYKCESIGAHRASILLARSVIEASAKEKGVTKGNLASKIDELAKQGHVRGLIADAAHEIRHVGNDMAHGDFATTPISQNDAQETLDFMEDFLRELFELPTRVARRRERRTTNGDEGGPKALAAGASTADIANGSSQS